MIENKEFIKLAERAINKGWRKVFIKKINTALLFKGRYYFNMSGIYTYNNGKFTQEATLTEENLLKIDKELRNDK